MLQVIDFLMPPVILWSPFEQYSHLLSPSCPKCAAEESSIGKLNPCKWTDGHSQDCAPRLLHDVACNVILVSRVYKCSNDHIVVGHHPRIVQQLSEMHLQCVVPFKLWYRSGFTQVFIEHVQQALNTGNSLMQIETSILSNRVQYFYSLREKFEQLRLHQPPNSQLLEGFPHFDDIQSKLWKDMPTHHSIAACYLLDYWEKDSAYANTMSCTTVSSENAWLSCDHTFRSVANVGMVRKCDKKWINQYSGLFCVLNEVGQILTWKMTRSVSFEDIKQPLSCLYE